MTEPVDNFADMSDGQLHACFLDSYKSALEVFADNYDGTAKPPRVVQPEPEQYMGRGPALHRGLPIPELSWINAWIFQERRYLALYQRDRAAHRIIPDSDKQRVMEAIRRIKELEYLIKTHYQSAINDRI